MSQRERKEKERKKGRKSQQALFGNNGDLISIFAVEDPHLGAREYPREPYTSAATTVVLPATAPPKIPKELKSWKGELLESLSRLQVS